MTAPISQYQIELLARARARIAKSQVRYGEKVAYPADMHLVIDLVAQIESLTSALEADAALRAMPLQDGAVAAERERCARIVDAEVIFARENLDTIPDEAEGDLGSRLTPRYYWGQRLALAKHYASEIRSPAVATILAEDGTK